MLHRLILKVTKFQLPPPKRLGTVVKNIFGGHHAPSPMSNRINALISTGPDNWKIAKIAPIFKSGLKSKMGNYRPI